MGAIASSRATMSSYGSVTGTGTNANGRGASVVSQDATPVACTGEPAATMAIRSPPGGEPVARSRAISPRERDPKNWQHARGSGKNPAGGPGLPPEGGPRGGPTAPGLDQGGVLGRPGERVL